MVSDDQQKPEAGELTDLLRRMQTGDRQASEEVVQLVYGELHRLASRELRHEHKGHILQTNSLIHEAYLRLAGTVPLEIQNRGHFFAIASQQMRRILVDAARRSGAQKRGSGAFHLDIEGLQIGARDRSANCLFQAWPRTATMNGLRRQRFRLERQGQGQIRCLRQYRIQVRDGRRVSRNRAQFQRHARAPQAAGACRRKLRLA